ncbi:hypothetical protein GCM10028818_41250 [Spirosoma horti]
MTDHQYRTYPAYSNSDLSELFAMRTGGQIKPIDPKAALFGTVFHSLILEPNTSNLWDKLHVKDQAHLLKMKASIKKTAPNWVEHWQTPGYHEIEKYWTCPRTGLSLKAKIDAQWQNPASTLFDLKTTSARSANEFFDCFVKYGYDRQAAFYLDAVGLEYAFIFVGIQKKSPYEVYIINMGVSDDRRAMIDLARRKNARLLGDAFKESQKPDGWRPSSWSRKEEV